MSNPVPQLFMDEKQKWLLEARRTARDLLFRQENITIMDVLAIKPFPKFLGKQKRNVIGSVFKDTIFKKVGYTRSNLMASRGHTIGVWTLREEFFVESQLRGRRAVVNEDIR